MVYSEALTHVHHTSGRCLCLAYLCVKSTASKEHTKQPRHYTDTPNGVWANGHGCHQMKECFTFTKQLVSVILVQNDFFQSYRKSEHVADTAHQEHLQKPISGLYEPTNSLLEWHQQPYKMFYVQWFKRHPLKDGQISVLKSMTLSQPECIINLSYEGGDGNLRLYSLLKDEKEKFDTVNLYMDFILTNTVSRHKQHCIKKTQRLKLG